MSGIVCMLMGGSSEPEITLAASYSPSRTVTTPATATATFAIENDGDIAINGSDIGDWISGGSVFTSNYEGRLTVNSGSTPSGSATGSYLNLGTTRSWSLAQSGIGTNSSNCTLEIRNAATTVVKASATVTFTATVSP